MALQHSVSLSIVMVVLSTIANSVGATGAGKTFPTLTVGGTTYTNVTITDVSGGSVFLKHSEGFETLRTDTLSPAVRQKLGLQPAAWDRSRRRDSESMAASSASSTRGEVGAPRQPRLERLSNILNRSRSAGKESSVIALPLAGLAMMIAGNIWLIVAAFRVSAGWGVGCLLGSFFCGLVNLIFTLANWPEAKKPFFCWAAGLVLFIGSGIAGPNMLKPTPSPDSPSADANAPQAELVMPEHSSKRVA